jgi:serine/threonine-protein kinase
MRWDLIVTGGPAAGRTFSIKEGEVKTIGRSRKAHIYIDDSKISRIHCAVSVSESIATLKDNKSRNGTFLNKKKIDTVSLKRGDMIYMGKTSIEIEPVDVAESSLIEARMVGPFRLVSRIGLGGMATVYLAERLPQRTRYALKILKGSIAAQAELLERFHREARAGLVLDHPNIVKIVEVGRESHTYYLVMEYCPGENLYEILEEETRLLVPRALSVASQVAEAVRHAYRHDIVHRDLKPENIIIAKTGLVKVTDFGLAKFLDQTTEEYLTHTGEGLGTLAYLPPEQIDKAKIADIRADIYSLGATLYHMIAGFPPIERPSLAEFFKAIRNKIPRPLRKVDKTVPKSVSHLVDKCLAKDPRGRYQTPDELAAELQRVIGEVS